MLSRPIYELLPYLYLIVGALLIMAKQNAAFAIAGLLVYFAGSLVWIMRSSQRRSVQEIVPQKLLFLPDWLYEFNPFLNILLAIFIGIYSELVLLWWVAAVLALYGMVQLKIRVSHREHQDNPY